MWFDEDINLVIETDPFINVSGSTSFSQIDNISINIKEDPIFINLSEYYAPVQSVNGKIGFVNIDKSDIGLSNVENISIVNTSGYLQNNIFTTGLNLDLKINSLSGNVTSNYATITNLALTGSTLQSQINNLNSSGFITGVDLSPYYLRNNPSGFITNSNLTGYQKKISTGISYAILDPKYVNFIDSRVSGYFYKKSEDIYVKIQPGGEKLWTQYNRLSDGKLEILYKDSPNDSPITLYRSSISFVSMGGLRPPWDPSVEWVAVSPNYPATGLPKFYLSQDFENVINLQSNLITSTPSYKDLVQEYLVHTPYNTTIGGYGYQFTRDTPSPEAGYNSWLMLKDSIYERAYNQTPIPLSAVFEQLLEFTSTVPSTPTGQGLRGAVAYDGTYLYICVNNNSWRRVSISTW